MFIEGIELAETERAVEAVADLFGGNVEPEIECAEDRIHVALLVRDVYGPGSRHGSVIACWHAYKAFINALPDDARVEIVGRATYPGDPWASFNIGQYFGSLLGQETCECHS